ncbi:MAG TPA: MIP/aquaporin family protein [Candidatus Acidoferrum sp.]|jgi:MIP family channel proteins|nr:MIP/aquaporin family protein [Candidatus Acidoferrum sp.]
MYSLPQKLVAEFVGTFTLIFIGAGSICADQYMKAGGGPGAGLLAIAAAHGLAIAIMVTAVGHISGGHLNPAVSIGFWVSRRLGTIQTLAYWVAQLAGATFAAYLLTLVVPEATWHKVALGTPDLATDYTRIHGMALEAALTFLLVFVVFATAADAKGAFDKIAGFAIGLTITMDILLGGPFTGAAMNPARAFGPALVAHHWTNHGVYWVGPLVGGVIAGFLYNAIFLRDQPPAQ